MPTRFARLRGFATTTALAGVVAAAGVTPAHAAEGNTTLKLDGPAANSLRASGVDISPLRSAKGASKQVALPIGAGLAGSTTTLLRHRGSISLRGADGKRLRLSKLVLTLGKRALVSAKLGRSEIDLFQILRGGNREIDPTAGTVNLRGLRLKLTRDAADEIAERLGLELRPRRFGTLSANASGLAAGGAPAGQGTDAQKSNECPLPSGAGPEPENPLQTLVRPPAAVDITSATIGWHVRESFIRYIGTGEGTSVSGGAAAEPPVLLPGASTPLSYDFHFPFSSGWLDRGANPADPADDTASIGFGGALRFLYSGHGIDLLTAEPEIEIAGANSRAVFEISEDGGAAERQVLVNLDLGRAAAITAAGSSYVYERVPGAIPAGAASSVFAGFYAPGTEFGCFTVSFTAP